MGVALSDNLKSINPWLRCVYMLIIYACLQIAFFVFIIVVLLQFVCVLITGSKNQPLFYFAQGFSDYLSQAFAFLMYVRDDKPFPFSDWPDARSEAQTAKASEDTPSHNDSYK